jgi:hypothetical protein
MRSEHAALQMNKELNPNTLQTMFKLSFLANTTHNTKLIPLMLYYATHTYNLTSLKDEGSSPDEVIRYFN